MRRQPQSNVIPLTPEQGGLEERAFISFASPEPRCLGALAHLRGYKAVVVCLLSVEDERNEERESNIVKFRRAAAGIGAIVDVPARHDDPIVGLDKLARTLREASTNSGAVTIDISTFPKNALLLTLRAIELVHEVTSVRVIYTEPETYCAGDHQGLGFGLKRTRVVPTFSAPFRPNQELILMMLLGYEGDRAVGMWQRIQPHRTIAAIGRPSYRPEWEGLAERINAPLLASLHEKDLHYVDPRNPWAIYDLLVRVVTDAPIENVFIVPLGTKPEAVGVFLFCRDFPEAATVIYAAPVDPKHQYIANGVGDTWVLATWETHHNE